MSEMWEDRRYSVLDEARPAIFWDIERRSNPRRHAALFEQSPMNYPRFTAKCSNAAAREPAGKSKSPTANQTGGNSTNQLDREYCCLGKGAESDYRL